MADTLIENSGRERMAMLAYAVGWTSPYAVGWTSPYAVGWTSPYAVGWTSRMRWAGLRVCGGLDLAYAVGWTQHSTGVQTIRAGAIVQMLLGNVGRPGGGVMAMRGHASIQGSSDIPTLYDQLPGYLRMPRAREGHNTLADFIEVGSSRRGWWADSTSTSSRC